MSDTVDKPGKRGEAAANPMYQQIIRQEDMARDCGEFPHLARRYRNGLRANGQTSYIHGDHLTSATNTTGSQARGPQRYYPYGETRGSVTVETPYRYTGQREEAGIGLYFYNARWYDSTLGRFLQPDTIVPQPGNAQALNRYAYVLSNPLKHTDPSGHGNEQSAQGGGGFDEQEAPDYWYDLEYWATDQFNANANLPEIKAIRIMYPASLFGVYAAAPSMYMFAQLVQDGAPMDYKDAMKEEFGYNIRLGDDWYEYSRLGNFSYGFTAAAAGIPLSVAHVGAGYALRKDAKAGRGKLGPLNKALDTVDDYYAVELGYEMYVQGYAPDQHLSKQEFHALRVSFEHGDKLALRLRPSPRKLRDADWPYSPGDFNSQVNPPRPPALFPSFQKPGSTP